MKILSKFFNKEQSHSDIYNICNDPIKVKHFLRKKDKLLKNKTKNIDDKKFPFPRSIKTIDALAKLRGSQIGKKAAESFEILREIN